VFGKTTAKHGFGIVCEVESEEKHEKSENDVFTKFDVSA
jgi:hypothetical protein